MACTTTCVQPSPSQAHCSVCHLTWSGVYAFDRHRKGGQCRTPAEIGYADDGTGVHRAPMTDKGRARLAALADSRCVVEPQTAQGRSGVGADANGGLGGLETISGGSA